MKKKNTSWEKVSSWYDKLVGINGHYYHKNVIFPSLLKNAIFKKKCSLLDLACGQGVLSRVINENIDYWGCDVSSSLISAAKKLKRGNFFVSDITKPLMLDKKDFDVITIILALQDIGLHDEIFQNCYNHLKPNGKLFLIINHPCFRIPRQTSWNITKTEQSRQVNRYMTNMTIPIKTNPGKKEFSKKVYFHHYPMQEYFNILNRNGFTIKNIQELISDKKSTGKNRKKEDLARKEIPLFLSIEAKKSS